MGLCKKILSISFKEKSIFRFDYLVNTLFSFFYIVLKVYLWKGLYGISGEAVSGIALNDMLVYSILSSFTAGITKTTVMNDLNINSVLLNLFSGALVPLWFFPEPMKNLSVFLPFRYIVFEPIAVLLNTKSVVETAYVFVMQMFWLVFLFCAATAVWNRGRNKIMIQGG